jgi:hypothetical protein
MVCAEQTLQVPIRTQPGRGPSPSCKWDACPIFSLCGFGRRGEGKPIVLLTFRHSSDPVGIADRWSCSGTNDSRRWILAGGASSSRPGRGELHSVEVTTCIGTLADGDGRRDGWTRCSASAAMRRRECRETDGGSESASLLRRVPPHLIAGQQPCHAICSLHLHLLLHPAYLSCAVSREVWAFSGKGESSAAVSF